MKIAIVGAGAMGSVYAGLLADAGNEVHARFAVIVQVLSNRGASTRLWQLELASASTQAEAGQ